MIGTHFPINFAIKHLNVITSEYPVTYWHDLFEQFGEFNTQSLK